MQARRLRHAHHVVAPEPPPPVKPEELAELRVMSFHPSRTDISEDDRRCSICLGDFERGVALRELRCQHHFHRDCIDT